MKFPGTSEGLLQITVTIQITLDRHQIIIITAVHLTVQPHYLLLLHRLGHLVHHRVQLVQTQQRLKPQVNIRTFWSHGFSFINNFSNLASAPTTSKSAARI